MSRILLVEDSKVQALVTQRLLEHSGYSVEHVMGVDEAVTRCYESTPDLVITDQMLGEVSGLEVCRRIKSDVALSVIPVLMLTGTHVQKDHIAALDAGADAFLSKDSSAEELLAVISHLLQDTVSIPPLGASSGETEPVMHRTRILVVDDSPTFLATLCRRLSDAGFDVTGASTGNQALSLLEEQPYDVAVTDVVMPQMDGFEFTLLARKWAIQQHRQLGLLVLTGAERKDVLLQSLEAGADDYVNKSQELDVIVAHATALARRIARSRQIEAINQRGVRSGLDRANRALEEVNEQLKQLTEGISQHLRTPLQEIVDSCGLLQIQKQDELDGESRDFIARIVQNAEKMQQFIGSVSLLHRENSKKDPNDLTSGPD